MERRGPVPSAPRAARPGARERPGAEILFARRGPGAAGALRGRGEEEHPSLTTVICTLNICFVFVLW